MAALGLPGVTGEQIRREFRRPFSAFYGGLFGRPVTDVEFAFIRRRYEAEYDAEVFGVDLQPDAGWALDLVAAHPASQSLLSMAHDDQLQALVDHHGIRSWFQCIEGSATGESDGTKAERLVRHLSSLEVDPRTTVVIGDTVDDHEAAVRAGASSVLVTIGTTGRAQLEATGAPVVDTLREAARQATGFVS
jgi:phosphoglycolate phosphatase-like HAD superfamily hydrolase